MIDRNSYGSIFKAIGIFGGVKAFQILVGIIKNKCVALLLGPDGMGIVGLISSGLQMVKSLTDFGLHTSAVRDISKSYSLGREENVGRTLSAFRKIVLLTGILGSLVVFILSDFLSKISFGSNEYALGFKIVAITLFLDQLCVGQTALMQGTFNYKLMARASLLGSILGLIISLPIYYIWKAEAIVPVIVITSLTALLLSWFFSRKIYYKKVSISFKDALLQGREMLFLGAAIALTSITRVGKVYGIRLFISNIGSYAEVGLYTSAMTISTHYIDVILSSMASDYSPRLSAIVDDRTMFIETINKQVKVMLATVIPLVAFFIIFVKEFVLLLYSDQFLAIITMIEWMMFSMLFRSVSWCLSFPLVALGNPKLYFWNETISEIYSFIFSMLGYLYFGFDGLGFAFFIGQLLFFFQMIIVSYKFYSFKFTFTNVKAVLVLSVILSIMFILVQLTSFHILRYVLGCMLVFVVLFISYRLISQMVNINNYIFKLLKLNSQNGHNKKNRA